MNKIKSGLLLILLVTLGVSPNVASLTQVKQVQVVNIASETATVQWQKVTSAKKYQVRILNNDKTLFNQSTTKKTNKAVAGLQSNTAYYVKVRAKQNTRKGKWSKLKQFTTLAADTDDDDTDNDDDGDDDG